MTRPVLRTLTTLLAMVACGFTLATAATAEAQQREFRVVFEMPHDSGEVQPGGGQGTSAQGKPSSGGDTDGNNASGAASPEGSATGVTGASRLEQNRIDTDVITQGKAISERLASLLKRRFSAAGVKDFRVEPRTFDVRVTIGGRDARQPKMLDLLQDSGRIEVRPVLEKGGPSWPQLSPVLPQGVEIRGETAAGYLWSLALEPLQETVSSASMLSPKTIGTNNAPPENRLIVAPMSAFSDQTVYQTTLPPRTQTRTGAGGYSPGDLTSLSRDAEQFTSDGWRSLLLGPISATSADIEKTEWDRGTNGTARVMITLRPSASTTPANYNAILLDDHLLALVPADQSARNQLTLTPPVKMSQEEKQLWARWVAGKTAAYIPIPYAIAKH